MIHAIVGALGNSSCHFLPQDVWNDNMYLLLDIITYKLYYVPH